ncbi:S-Ena type endospore appendage [Sutcliffiella horikoshii]|uniref:S-Ena type endospore appendage n=1 Tax=Sutcliffiella horikoshii TaxID=79883 RepID=UPI00384C697F
MCGVDGGCCPSGHVLQEELCGNYAGELSGVAARVWEFTPSNLSDYIEGTVQVFNASNSNLDVVISRASGGDVDFVVAPHTTASRSVLRPTALIINANEGQSGKYCIKLYKRVY